MQKPDLSYLMKRTKNRSVTSLHRSKGLPDLADSGCVCVCAQSLQMSLLTQLLENTLSTLIHDFLSDAWTQLLGEWGDKKFGRMVSVCVCSVAPGWTRPSFCAESAVDSPESARLHSYDCDSSFSRATSLFWHLLSTVPHPIHSACSKILQNSLISLSQHRLKSCRDSHHAQHHWSRRKRIKKLPVGVASQHP